jgi:hypothetical protein
MMDNVKTFWTWNWKSGGYNSCSISECPTIEAAILRAEAIGKPIDSRTVGLTPYRLSFRKVTTREMCDVDRSWASAFD